MRSMADSIYKAAAGVNKKIFLYHIFITIASYTENIAKQNKL
jgi:hypothetical protein